MAAFPGDGFRDFGRRLRLLGLWVERARLRRALFNAEAELGWLGWEQVDFFDEETNAAVAEVREFENTQASLQNTSAELAGKKAAIEAELAREKAVHDEAQAALDAERAPIEAALKEAESTRQLKLGAGERFERALEDIAKMERRLEARSLGFLNVPNPTPEIRYQAREVSDELARLAGERMLVLADKATAANDAVSLERRIAELRVDLQYNTAASAGAHETLAAATRRLTGDLELLNREQKQSSLHMSHLDRRKQQPYRNIGANMADHGIAPLNQPQVLEKVFDLRERDRRAEEAWTALRDACAAADPGLLVSFYLVAAALLFAVCAVASHFL